MMPRVTLHMPGVREMDYRQKLLAQPETMSYNAGLDLEAEGYDPATGCIDFPMSDWRYWRDVWLWREPDRFSAYIRDEDTGAFVGEACYYYDMESDAHGVGVIIEHTYRGRGYGTAALRLLVAQASRHPEVTTLFVDLPADRESAVRMYLTAGFREVRAENGVLRLAREALAAETDR